MAQEDKELVLKRVKERNVKFIRLWFTDVLGFLKSFAITPSELEGALEDGMGFDGSSIEGFARIEESDMIAKPDPGTFAVLPWRTSEDSAVARMFCDVLEPDGSPYKGDPRWALKRALNRVAEHGYTFYVGPELEYFYFRDAKGTATLDAGGYFDLTPLDVASDLRQDTILALESMGIRVEYSHHEVATSQHEIDLRYMEALSMADAAMTYRLTVKEVAMKHGVYATFMPKPLFGHNGSGMHTHQSLFRGEENALFDAGDARHLSEVGKRYIAGLLRHAREICRSTLVRVPMYKPGKEHATRVEFRCPDPACNPYLAFAVMLAAGLRGIEEGYDLPPPVEEDIFEMSPQKRAEKGIESLPGSLAEAIAETEKSDLVREALGEHIFAKFIANKKIEWDRYRTHVSQYELERYLPVL